MGLRVNGADLKASKEPEREKLGSWARLIDSNLRVHKRQTNATMHSCSVYFYKICGLSCFSK